MPPETEGFKKTHVCLQNLFGWLTIENFIQHCHHAFDDERITVSTENQVAFFTMDVKPDAGLAPCTRRSSVLRADPSRQVLTQFNQVFILFPRSQAGQNHRSGSAQFLLWCLFQALLSPDHANDAFDTMSKRFQVFTGIVESKRRPHRASDVQCVHDWLSALLTGAYGDAFGVQQDAEIIVLYTLNVERQNGGAVFGIAVDLQVRDSLK